MKHIGTRKYKDESPRNTLNRIRNILNDLGILTVQKGVAHFAKWFYSLTIGIENTTLSTNGKGTTYEYALASAYGELMERLQNQAPFRLNTDVSQEAIEYKGFFYAPDEKQMSIEDVLKSKNGWIKEKLTQLDSSIDQKELLKKWQDISYEESPCGFIAIPFCNMNSGKLSYIPMKMVSKMYMSNGMCAGNSPEEALVQGISEVLERNVNQRIMDERITPPTIPMSYLKKYPKIEMMIKQIELSGNYSVLLKDCSLGQGLPVVGVIFINRDQQNYFVKFGSHPAFEIAAERTLTELLQGQDVRNMRGVWEFSFRSNMEDEHSNLLNILVNGCGWYPPEFFKTTPSYEFRPFEDVSRMTNKEMLKYLINLLKTKGHDTYVRDVSFLGFPAFHVIVPGFSEIEEINEVKELDEYAEFVKFKKLIRNMKHITDEDIESLSTFLEKKDLSHNTTVLQILNLPISNDLPWYYADVSLFTTALYCKKGDFSSAYRVFERFLGKIQTNTFHKPMVTYYKCMRDYLAARSDGLDDRDIIEMLGTFYPLSMIKGVIKEIGNPETIFPKQNLIKCYDCGNCQFKYKCQYKNTERVFRVLKERYATSRINQQELMNLVR
ncbi:MAG: YcaO-like family protein [Halanaerobiales bacterium]|nr:YcaO-like family protein [Halanaerobiales bacterium]